MIVVEDDGVLVLDLLEVETDDDVVAVVTTMVVEEEPVDRLEVVDTVDFEVVGEVVE